MIANEDFQIVITFKLDQRALHIGFVLVFDEKVCAKRKARLVAEMIINIQTIKTNDDDDQWSR